MNIKEKIAGFVLPFALLGLIIFVTMSIVYLITVPKETDYFPRWCIDRRFGFDACYSSKQEARDLSPTGRIYSR